MTNTSTVVLPVPACITAHEVHAKKNEVCNSPNSTLNLVWVKRNERPVSAMMMNKLNAPSATRSAAKFIGPE